MVQVSYDSVRGARGQVRESAVVPLPDRYYGVGTMFSFSRKEQVVEPPPYWLGGCNPIMTTCHPSGDGEIEN